jgi:hypothetical protein
MRKLEWGMRILSIADLEFRISEMKCKTYFIGVKLFLFNWHLQKDQ